MGSSSGAAILQRGGREEFHHGEHGEHGGKKRTKKKRLNHRDHRGHSGRHREEDWMLKTALTGTLPSALSTLFSLLSVASLCPL
jgi:hypothetical protein